MRRGPGRWVGSWCYTRRTTLPGCTGTEGDVWLRNAEGFTVVYGFMARFSVTEVRAPKVGLRPMFQRGTLFVRRRRLRGLLRMLLRRISR